MIIIHSCEFSHSMEKTGLKRFIPARAQCIQTFVIIRCGNQKQFPHLYTMMVKQAIISLFLLITLGQCCLHAQDVSAPDSLKMRYKTPETIKTDPETNPTPIFPTIGIENDLFPGRFSPSYIDTRGWGMRLYNPVLPWGLQGSNTNENYIGLGASRAATIQKGIHSGNFTFSAYSSVQNHFYEYNNATIFLAGGSASYAISKNWTATIFGRYATNPGIVFSPAIQAMLPSSNFGVYATYRFDNFSVSGGVRREFNPYTNSWETYPIVMPKVKVGGVDIGIDVGPIIKEGVQQMNRKQQDPPPPPPANRR